MAFETKQAPREALLQPGDQVDHYHVVRLLGRGGFGDVYLARDTRLGRRVALKVVHPEHLGSKEATERFLFEARATARFAHPHIITVFGVGEHEGTPYVALEFLEGRTLRQVLRDERPSRPAALRYALAIAEALTEAHGANILHRDLKPENVILPRDGRLRVLDFGLAKKLGPSSPQGAAVTEVAEAIAPTEAMPPPRLVQPPQADAQSDTIALPQLEQPDQGQTLPPTAGAEATPLPLAIDAEATPTEEYATLLSGYDSSAESGVRGTPFYMSPEQWSGGEQSSAVDVWALGVLLHELISGRFPFRASQPLAVGYEVCSARPLELRFEDDDGVPAELVALVARCLCKDPRRRPEAADVVVELRALLSPAQQQLAEEQGPFRGLLPFGERHAGLYFGREAELAAFLEQLRDEPTLAVVGPSGAGKSSFVAAGVVPRMREQGPLVLLRLRPGGDPFAALAARLRAGEQLSTQLSQLSAPSKNGSSGDTTQLAAELAEAPSRLGLELRQLAERHGARVLLFVDQLEELYTQVDDPELRRRFTSALHAAADDPLDPVRVIVTLRDDFLGRVAEGQDARRLLSRVTVLRSPDRAALRAILTRSAEAFGYRYEDDAIVDEMIAAIDDEPACLPLLSFAGRMLWERRDREAKLLRRADYEAMGGVAGALASHADAVIKALSAAQVGVARQLLLRLITAEGTRHTVERGKLLEGLGGDAELVLSRLTEARLLTSGRRGDGDAELELAHERLIDSWGRLSRWIDESREERIFLAEIGQAAALWQRRGERDAEVWQGEALEEARKGLDRCVSVSAEVGRFVAAGEAYEVEQQRAAKRRRGIIRGGLIGAAVAIIGMTVAWGFTLRSEALKVAIARDDAMRQLVRAHSEAAGLAMAQRQPHKARALFRAALERALDRRRVDKALLRQLRLTAFELEQEPLRLKIRLGGLPRAMAFSHDGATLWLLEGLGLMRLDVATGTRRRVLEAKRGGWALAVDRRGRFVAVACQHNKHREGSWGALLLLHPEQGNLLRSFPLPNKPTDLAVVDGNIRFIAAGSLWELASGEGQLRRLTPAPARGSDARLRAHAATSGALRYVRGFFKPRAVERNNERPWQTLPRGDRYWQVAYAGGVWVAGRGSRAPVHELVFEPGGRARALAAPTAVTRIVGTPQHALLAVGLQDGRVQLWDAERLTVRATVRLPAARVWHLSWSGDGQVLAAASRDDLAVWRVGPLLQRASRGHERVVISAAISPGGTRVASSGHQRTLLWDAKQGRLLRRLTSARVDALAMSPDGRRLVGAGADGTIFLWDARTGRQLRLLRGHGGPVVDVSFDAQGRFATISTDKTVRLWSSEGKQLRTLELPAVPLQVAFHPSGKRLAVAVAYRKDRLLLIDLASGERRWRWPSQLVGMKLRSVRYDRDGRLLVVDHTGSTWVDDRKFFGGLAGLGMMRTPGDYTGRHLYLSAPGLHNRAGLLLLARRPKRRIVRKYDGHRAPITTVVEDGSGRTLVTGDHDGVLRFWSRDARVPRAHTPLLIAGAAPRLYSRRGVRTLRPGLTPARWQRPEHAWERAVVTRALDAQRSQDRSTLCMLADDYALELWDLKTDRRLLRRPYDRKKILKHLVQIGGVGRSRLVGAYQRSCMVLVRNTLMLERPGRPSKKLADRVIAVTFQREPLILVTNMKRYRLLRLASDGRQLRDHGESWGSQTFDFDGRALLVSNRSLIVRPWDSDEPQKTRRVPLVSGRLASVASGPLGTILYGSTRGSAVIWDLEGQRKVLQLKLRGPLLHLARVGHHAYFATEQGDVEVVDLAPLMLDPCALLRRVWRRLPAIWIDGKLTPRGAPARHRCLER
jgi:serine/threonine protein kinase/WD40 repeat protein